MLTPTHSTPSNPFDLWNLHLANAAKEISSLQHEEIQDLTQEFQRSHTFHAIISKALKFWHAYPNPLAFPAETISASSSDTLKESVQKLHDLYQNNRELQRVLRILIPGDPKSLG